MNFKKLSETISKKITDEKGFVLAEFVIALPLLILLIYSLVFMVFNMRKSESLQAADYILEEEAQEILDKITKDARAAKKISLETFGDSLPLLILLIYSLVFMVFNMRKSESLQAADYILEEEAQEILDKITKDARAAKKISLETFGDRQDLEIIFHTISNENQREVPDILDSRVYILYSKAENFTEDGREKITHVYVHRQPVSTPTSPISGENSSADTTVKKLKFTMRGKKLLHISLQIKSLKTERTLSINTSVFMPDCEKVIGFEP